MDVHLAVHMKARRSVMVFNFEFHIQMSAVAMYVIVILYFLLESWNV